MDSSSRAFVEFAWFEEDREQVLRTSRQQAHSVQCALSHVRSVARNRWADRRRAANKTTALTARRARPVLGIGMYHL
ncbi:hypothetical protein EYR26_21635 [Xanthomonas oryzae]|nr:hypothetical protein EYR26_21635 [Xanthomonas oryzae]